MRKMLLFVIGKKGAKAPNTTTTPKQQHLQNGKKDKKTSAKENVVLLALACLLVCLYILVVFQSNTWIYAFTIDFNTLEIQIVFFIFSIGL